jgi:4'-phosphopantetheinyl transferase
MSMAVSPRDAMQTALDLARVDEVEEYGVQVWTAQPAELDEAQWPALGLLLDEAEELRSRQFKMAQDRRAYVLAHALRRAALACALAVAPHEIVVSHEAGGKPVLAGPAAKGAIFFSHSRSRDAVVFALSHAAPIGIDVASVDTANADFDLLARFVALPEAKRREAELGSDPARQFFFYWTALEAFWKAAGTGLASGNPRIRCQKNRLGTFDILLDMSSAQQSSARVIPINSAARYMVTLACLTPSG